LAHLSILSILEAMHAHQLFVAKTQKLSMLLTLHDNHHYKNEENNKYAHTFALHLEGTKCLPCDDHAKLQLVERRHYFLTQKVAPSYNKTSLALLN
jgi:hypothetical protein